MTNTNKKKLLLTTLLSGLTYGATVAPAMAQAAAEDEIIVTGSRLNVNPNLTAASPVLTVSDEEIAIRGTINIEDLTNNLPQVFAGQASEVANGASGTATLNLRGLGSVRTLTLIDGKRLPYGSSGTSSVNLDLVPTNLVERVEILTGGASAVYGSDAVGGVANFILKDDFEGFEVDVQYGQAQNSNGLGEFDSVFADFGGTPTGSSWDGNELNVSATLGLNSADGKGNIVLFGAYQNREAITQDDRSFSQCSLQSDENGYGCFGSANFRLFAGPGGLGFQAEDGTIVPFTGGSEQRYNFGPLNYFQRPAERFQMYAKGHYEIAEDHEVFVSASFTDNISDAQIAETASFGFGAYSINCDNPFIQNTPGISLTDLYGCSAEDIAAGNDVSGITASHRNVEGGPRNSRLENSAFRLTGGLRGTVMENWDYELFAQFSETSDQSTSTNDFIIANLQDAFFAVDDGNGNVVCRSGNPGCVPYNIFQRSAGGGTLVSQESTDFIQGVGIVNGNTEQVVVGGNIQTDLGNYGISSPMAEEGVGLLVGFEYREDSLESRPDEISQVPGGGFTGVGGATLPVSGNVDLAEFYAELQIPVVTDAPFAKEFILSGQYRYSDYETDGNGVSNSFSTSAYGVQAAWAPVDDLKLRAQFQRAVRAPNVIELFTGQDSGLPNLNLGPNGNFDPCAGPNPSATLAQCMNTGVTAAQFGTILDVISGQTQSITGGNPNLTPEESDTITLGAVFTPSADALSGLTASIDYFDITVSDFITAGIGVQTTLDQCIATGDDAFCDLITRDPSGSLNAGVPGVGFLATNLNIAEVETSGFDLQVGYRFDLNGGQFGDMAIQYAATILDKFDFTPFPGGTVVECAGKFGNDCVQPVNSSYRHRALVTWNTPFEGVSLNTTWRHFGGVDNISETPAPLDERLDAVNYFDLAGVWALNEKLTFRAGVNNLFLDQPPVSVSAGPALGNGNTYPTIYDTGRFVFMGARFNF